MYVSSLFPQPCKDILISGAESGEHHGANMASLAGEANGFVTSGDHGVRLTLLSEGVCSHCLVITSFDLLYALLTVFIGFGDGCPLLAIVSLGLDYDASYRWSVLLLCFSSAVDWTCRSHGLLAFFRISEAVAYMWISGFAQMYGTFLL
ncbi:hypothetical protein Tco_1009709 [Tanacetum coccineum]